MIRVVAVVIVALVGLAATYRGVLTADLVYEGRHLTEAPVAGPPPWVGAPWVPRHADRWIQYLTRDWSAAGLHGLNLALHGLAAGLVAWLLWRLPVSRVAAGLGAMLVLVHPLTVEPIMSIASRTELLATCGILVACLLATGPWWAWLGIPVALIAALFAKETAIVGLALVPVIWYARWPSRAMAGLVALGAVIWWPVAVLWFGSVAVVQALGLGVRTPGELDPATLERLVSWPAWALMQGTAAARLLLVSLLPAWRGFTPDYDYDILPIGVRVLSVLALAVLAWVAWRATRNRPVCRIGLLWMGLAVLPRVVIQTPGSYLIDHQVYLAGIGLVLVGVGAWDAWRPTRAWVPSCAAAVVLVGCLTQTHALIGIWSSELTLAAHTAEQAPQKPRALNNYGVYLAGAGRLTEARMVFARAAGAAEAPWVPAWDRTRAQAAATQNLAALARLEQRVAALATP